MPMVCGMHNDYIDSIVEPYISCTYFPGPHCLSVWTLSHSKDVHGLEQSLLQLAAKTGLKT